MSILLNGDCLDEMKNLDDDSVDFIFCDLPYGQTSCKWDCCIDLEQFWKEIMRIKKLHTPIFMTTTTKFGVSLINSAPKKCPFRYDLVWVKSAPAGFLSAKKMPMRKHEMVYAFYEKLPFYDLSSHKHKFIKERDTEQKNGKIYEGGKQKKIVEGKYDPPLPTSVVKEEAKMNSELYGELPTTDSYAESVGMKKADKHKVHYDPPLPVSIIKGENNTYNTEGRNKPIVREPAGKYNPPLPTSVVKEEAVADCYQKNKTDDSLREGHRNKKYEPPLPVSVVKEDMCKYDVNKNTYGGGKEGRIKISKDKKDHQAKYEPPLPTTMLEIKSTKGKHSTEKPVALMEWLLKYYSKEGDVVLDPTMGSGSTGVACKNLGRNFIGIEKDEKIFQVACERVYD